MPPPALEELPGHSQRIDRVEVLHVAEVLRRALVKYVLHRQRVEEVVPHDARIAEQVVELIDAVEGGVVSTPPVLERVAIARPSWSK